MKISRANRMSRGLLTVALVLSLALPVVAGEFKIDLRTSLTGPALNGVVPKGKAEFQLEGALRRLAVEVDNINLADGTTVSVLLNGNAIGSITLANQGGTLLLSTAAGQNVPMVSPGDTLSVTWAGTTVLTGKF